ncbi:hypothetical protein COCON_G00136450 [Conger conger]|uniref:Uncharacterized protein n=1 Tax=Conger conger TaxID=82655 RepID=A0A9Q1DF15_CONCO|nr:hypothetical protein COCON_G00136450 [Conger conger]
MRRSPDQSSSARTRRRTPIKVPWVPMSSLPVSRLPYLNNESRPPASPIELDEPVWREEKLRTLQESRYASVPGLMA